MFAGSRTPSAMTAMTPTTTNDTINQAWFGLDAFKLPRSSASWNPEASVIATSVGMTSTIFGMNFAENSARAGIESRPRIGRR